MVGSAAVGVVIVAVVAAVLGQQKEKWAAAGMRARERCVARESGKSTRGGGRGCETACRTGFSSMQARSREREDETNGCEGTGM